MQTVTSRVAYLELYIVVAPLPGAGRRSTCVRTLGLVSADCEGVRRTVGSVSSVSV